MQLILITILSLPVEQQKRSGKNRKEHNKSGDQTRRTASQ